ncbi:GLUG motif-containing protein [Bacteroides sp. ET336]|uniref:GLUG motif-containing protein n=1 Tax=Bacteroides sp. ET336 TaxID=2972459 RepID=UPI0021AC1A34|nr:GLUG motif-containing protein [Bacteroides sp. ET336]MCR8893494.1 hypothetical protein [Bacteroides sp. ET336]MDN0057991.1 GLUG motif-containing protein [Bacteroides caecigallinarum]
MKKRHSIHLLLAAAALLLATAACTKDELADGDRLPEGQYPLEIARITLSVEGGEAQPWGTPATRVSENGDGTGSVWEWDGSEMIGVQLGDKTTTYTLNTDHTLLADRQLYWTSTAPNQPVTAWYPATDGTLDLRDQDTNGLAYLLHGTGTGDYLTPVTLTFTHSLAKVRVTPTGDALGEVQSLQLYTYTQCTYEKGTVVQGSQEGWIEMKKCEYTENGNAFTCWEANVVPGYTITKLMANNDNKERDLSAAITPEAGKFYDITLDKDKGYTVSEDGNTYEVYNPEGLKNIAELVNSGATGINITLDTDLDLTDMEWTPIGNYEKQYTGTFDGNGKTITGLTFNQSETNNVGLIGSLGENGIVRDVKLDKVTIKANNNVGGIVGGNRGGSIIGCSVSGDISGARQVGGVVGYFGVGYNVVTACYHEGSVSGSVSVGGVAGDSAYGSLTACYHAGNVSGSQYVGGVAGYNSTTGTVTACYWSGYDGTGIGTGTAQATKVDDTTVTWHNAVDGMNSAIETWNTANPDKTCDWQYELGDEGLPVLTQQP